MKVPTWNVGAQEFYKGIYLTVKFLGEACKCPTLEINVKILLHSDFIVVEGTYIPKRVGKFSLTCGGCLQHLARLLFFFKLF